jgi:hypothetical protein
VSDRLDGSPAPIPVFLEHGVDAFHDEIVHLDIAPKRDLLERLMSSDPREYPAAGAFLRGARGVGRWDRPCGALSRPPASGSGRWG